MLPLILIKAKMLWTEDKNQTDITWYPGYCNPYTFQIRELFIVFFYFILYL
jgi:hypothetical protein